MLISAVVKMLRDGHYHIVFAHPETLISSKYGRELLLSDKYQEHVVAIVVDQAHCIVDWLVNLILSSNFTIYSV